MRKAKVEEIQPLELRALLESGTEVLLIDVRQIEEFERVALPNAHLIPLMELRDRWQEVADKAGTASEVVVYCRSGGRSALAVEFLEGMGMSGLKNLRGGINAYATEADDSLEPY